MERQRFLVTEGNSELDFVINDQGINVKLEHAHNSYAPVTVTEPTGKILPAVLKAFRSASEVVLNKIVREQNLSGHLDIRRTLELFDKATKAFNSGRLHITGAGTEQEPYRLSSPSDTKSIGKPTIESGALKEEAYAKACVTAVRSFTDNLIGSTVKLAAIHKTLG